MNKHRAIVIMLLATLSECAGAEWIKVGGNDSVQVTFYADPATIRRVENRVTMWVLVDQKTPEFFGDKPYLSHMEQDEYDCLHEQSRMLYLNAYAGNMARGDVVYTGANPDHEAHNWFPIAPGTIDETLWILACLKKKTTPPAALKRNS